MALGGYLRFPWFIVRFKDSRTERDLNFCKPILLLMEEIRLTSWYGEHPILHIRFHRKQVVQDSFHQQYLLVLIELIGSLWRIRSKSQLSVSVCLHWKKNTLHAIWVNIVRFTQPGLSSNKRFPANFWGAVVWGRCTLRKCYCICIYVIDESFKT